MPILIEKLSAKQALLEAQSIVERYHGLRAVSSRKTEFQGMFSKTFVIELEDESEWVVQLRDNEIDTTKVALAHSKLGDVVPPVHRVASDKAFFAFVMPFMRGTVWANKEDLSTESRVSIATQIGSLLGRCALREGCEAMVDSYVVPRLEYIIKRSFVNQPHPQLQARIQGLIEQTDVIKVLPLAIIHEDVNAMNVILNDANQIAALVDWEAASLLPLGTNGWCIRFLSFVNRNRVDYEMEYTLPMTKGFWDGFFGSIPIDLLEDSRKQRTLDAVVTSMQIGLVLSLFWPGNEGLSIVQMDQGLARLNWLEEALRPMAVAAG